MKKIYLLIFASFIFFQSGFSQRSFSLGVSGGFTNYFGDLGNEAWIQTGSTRPGVAVTMRNFLKKPGFGFVNSPFDMEFRMSWHRIGLDETKPIYGRRGSELKNYGRGINFRNDLFGFSTHVTYTLYSNRRKPLYQQSAAWFFFTGVGVFYGVPRADLFRGNVDINNRYYFWSDGTVRDATEKSGKGNVIKKDGKYETVLSDWSSEMQNLVVGEGSAQRIKYSNWHIGIPIGTGFRYGLSKHTTLSVEFGYYKFFTDYLDDVSDQYATYAQINGYYPNDPEKQEIAKYISDPTGKGTIGYPSQATSPRGNPKENDSYSYVNLELCYKFSFRAKLPKWF